MASQAVPRESKSYGQILRSTVVIGGSSVVGVAFGILRSKAIALTLGPTGIGLFGVYNSILDLAESAAGLGMQSSGVRKMAESVGTRDLARVARTALVLRRVSLALGVVGAVALIALALPISHATFGEAQHAAGIALLSAALFFRIVAAGQTALIQGLRRIGDLARVGVIGAFVSTVVSIPAVLVFGEEGVVPAIIAIAGASVLTSWWFSRRIALPPAAPSGAETLAEAADLIKFGIAFMATGFMTLGTAYLVRIMVLRDGGMEAAGLYQSAWTLGGLYAGFVLQAMGADFYPRLTAVAQDNGECNRLVNEQMEISMLLAVPGVLVTLTFATPIMTLFYSESFAPAALILRWICLGMVLRIVAWPLGFIVLAKGARRIFIWTEAAAVAVQIALTWLLIDWLGTVGAGMGFFGLYVWHSVLIYFVARRMSGYRLSAANRRIALVLLILVAVVFVAFEALDPVHAMIVGLLSTAAGAAYSLSILQKLILDSGSFDPSGRLAKLLGFARRRPSGA